MRSTMTIVLALTLLSGLVFAEIPTVISYQGKVTDTSGNPVADANYTMRFRIYDVETEGTPLWDSGARTVAVAGGVFSVLLGESPQPALTLDFDTDYWLAVRFSGVDQTPRQRLASAGYAYMASGLVPGTRIVGTVPELLGAVLWAQNAGTTGSTDGVYGRTDCPEGTGLTAEAVATTGENRGVYGRSYSSQGYGVYGFASATGGTTNGVRGQTSSPDGRGVYGYATATSGQPIGVMGASLSTAGVGVYGTVTQSTGTTYGAYGTSSSTAGTGVFGWAIAAEGLTHGVYGRSSSTAGTGVFGFASATSGATFGVRGEASSSIAAGVYGEATHGSSAIAFGGYFHSPSTAGAGVAGYASATTGTVRAVSGSTPSSSGRGVHGEATGTTGTNHGVLGTSASTGGTGVSGYALSSTGEAHGVRGTSASDEGAGVYGKASSGNGHGVHGEGPRYGVYGETTNTSGSTYGVYGVNSTADGAGVYGTGDNRGVYGRATTGSGEKYGVYGYSSGSDGRGVYGQASAYGVYGSASNAGSTSFGVYGTTASDYGGSAVYGRATGTFGLNFGVYGTSASEYGRGVCGEATATEGTTFGVYGISDSPDGYGVYYSGGFAGIGKMRSIVRTSQGPTGLDVMTAAGNWVEDFGEGQLVNGECHVELEPLFLEMVTITEVHPMHVFVEPHGPCRSTYVERGLTGFDVVEQDGGSSTVSFSYRVVAKRKGLEMERLQVCPAGFGDPLLYPELTGASQLERFRHMSILSGNAHVFDELTIQAEGHRRESEMLESEERRLRRIAVSASGSAEASSGHSLEQREDQADVLRLLRATRTE